MSSANIQYNSDRECLLQKMSDTCHVPSIGPMPLLNSNKHAHLVIHVVNQSYRHQNMPIRRFILYMNDVGIKYHMQQYKQKNNPPRA